MKLLLKNAYLLKDPFSQIQKTNLLIQDGKISKIGEIQEDADQVYDLSGKLVMPGLVNCHTHAAMTLMRGIAEDMNLEDWLNKKIFPIEAKLTAEHVYYGTMIAQMEMARKGIVAYVDMYFHCDSVAQAAVDFGMKALITRGLVDIDGDGERRLKENILFFEKWNGKDGLIEVGFGPHAPYTCSLKYIDKVAYVAQQLNAPVTIHLYESRSETYQLEDILSTNLANCKVIFAHCVHLKDEYIPLLAKENFFVAHNPTSNLKLGNGIAPIKKLLDHGVQVCLGTDGAASNNTLDILHEMRLATLLQKMNDPSNITVEQALCMATIFGAKASGLTSGKLQVGEDADLIVLDVQRPWFLPFENMKAHLVHSASSLDVFATMVKGKWIYYDGNYPTVQIKEIIEGFENSVRDLTQNNV
ncbi:amidohydrolase [Pseudothermotoga thermarum]|uniref:5-methylthioadenosine/S-adenosylhomocysteine deaminase n=1 Tax=Pseudothermotoga thermarum DSM 5069 TaxID=688269 RepID=F7YXK7_9THEM|nr:amidohydrolase [Pseudothermotoga thermarum]AEH50648.1 amidohydrolase [Pseudothermotoga thermarum DSM 5069]